MTMTVSRLHKMLGALIESGHGRKPVLVDRSTFSDPRDNDGLLMLPPWDVQGPRWIPTADDDGGTKWNKDGTESGTRCVLIVGGNAEPEAPAGVWGTSIISTPEYQQEQRERNAEARAALDASPKALSSAWADLPEALRCHPGVKRLYRIATSGVAVDRGPWSVVTGVDGKPELFSDDFEHDVKLRISGDFADDQQRLNYANGLAAQLNAARGVTGTLNDQPKEN